MFEIVHLKTGGKSLRSLAEGETFHPGIGPIAEARLLHVNQHRLLERAALAGRFTLWDVGLGAAANAVAAVEAYPEGSAGELEIHSFDITSAPLEFALEQAHVLQYPVPHRSLLEELLHHGSAERPNLRWFFHRGDFREELRREIPRPDGIFYDPYSPFTNRAMWTLPQFKSLRNRLTGDCRLSTYTRSTAVRVSLLLAGFYVGAGCEIGEKDETTVAATNLDLLESPLPRAWLDRVKISRNGAPIHDGEYVVTPISDEDFATLAGHPQFLA